MTGVSDKQESRDRAIMIQKASAQGKCSFFQMGGCAFGNECRSGKHEVSSH